jgi:alanyl-tRNA synthetase
MNAKELRRKYIEFFESKGHLRHDSAPLAPIDVTGKLDETLLFTGAGMVQFKPYFRGIAKPPHTRLVDSQKCVRAVDIEEVGNPSHLTFFEMLGNFSFGDYFKKEAVEWAWEFLFSPEWLALDPAKVCVTVFEEDDEAYGYWEPLWKSVGFDPSQKIVRLGEDKNYWPAGALSGGPPGPCGTCSEIFYQTAPDSEMVGDYRTDEAAGRWLEIWNLVFMQYEWKGHLKDPERPHLGWVKDGMDPLPIKCIDTGSGLERTASVLGGFSSVYETDVFAPILQKICSLCAHAFGTSPEIDRAVRVIADHIRTASFCIADGILPSNHGRGYVLRRLIRRSVLKGDRTLGLTRPFLRLVFPAVIEALGDPFVELSERREAIEQTLAQEEEQFRRTMSEGYTKFNAILAEHGNVSGADAFFLHDTYGFPLEVTQELADEHGQTVDLDEFRACMKEAQERSRAAQGAGDVFGGKDEELVLATSPDAPPVSTFVGYHSTEHHSRLVQISPRFDKEGKTTGNFQISLDETPFYAESGGQVGDTGTISSDVFEFQITNTWKEMGQIWHDASLVGIQPQVFSSQIGDSENRKTKNENLQGLSREEITPILQSGFFFRPVIATVDDLRRKNICRNHTATHLLHAALREVLGKQVTQAGSLVAPDRLRFDFTHGKALTPDEIAKVEEIVNSEIAAAPIVNIYNDVPLSEARKKGAMMLFGEKYGDSVRMVEVPGFSLELCGGCHVRAVSEIGLFKIIGEASSASGVRRIEALTGFGAYDWVRGREALVRETAALLKTNPGDLPKAAEKLASQVKELKKLQEKSRAGEAASMQVEPKAVGECNLYVHALDNGDSEEGKLLVDRLIESDPYGVGLVVVSGNGKVTFFCKAGKEAVAKGAHAGDLAREVAKLTGGGGGGSPAFAQAGGRDAAKIPQALAAAEGLLAAMATSGLE